MGQQLGMRDEQPIPKNCPEFCREHRQGLSLGDNVQPCTRFGALPTLVYGVVDLPTLINFRATFRATTVVLVNFRGPKNFFEVCVDRCNLASGRPEEKSGRRPEVSLLADVVVVVVVVVVV